jgi:hypothetical protein
VDAVNGVTFAHLMVNAIVGHVSRMDLYSLVVSVQVDAVNGVAFAHPMVNDTVCHVSPLMLYPFINYVNERPHP